MNLPLFKKKIKSLALLYIPVLIRYMSQTHSTSHLALYNNKKYTSPKV